MSQLKYPIGIQTFSKIRRGGYTYVDKTHYIEKLLSGGNYVFLSRPRRFGKSLLLSTLHSYFEGDRELFKGLTLDKADISWNPIPVLHFDFNSENYLDERGLEYILDFHLRNYENIYGRDPEDTTISHRFSSLIRHAYEQTGEEVAILIDEYDKPLLAIEDDESLFVKNQGILKSFFGNLKTMDRYIRFAMITGVARFSKVSIFSDLNNLTDISLSPKYADICGWTMQEVVDTFKDGIEDLSTALGYTYDETLSKLKKMYDGYMFAEGGQRLYNPFSLLNALYHGQMGYYWYQTGTPTFLAKRIRKAGISLPSLNNCLAYASQLTDVELHDKNPIPLLFQTGYLTIKDVDSDLYTLEFPNKEVEIGFARNLQPLYLPQMDDLSGPFSIVEFKKELTAGNPQAFMLRMQTLLKEIPYEKHDEQLYQNFVYLLFTLVGANAKMEEHTNVGRHDIVVCTPSYVYIFEFKINQSAESAIKQIRERDYAGKFLMDNRKVFLIGANFSDKSPNRGLTDYLIESID